jgi:hypothetical protein
VRRGLDIHVVTYHNTWKGYHKGVDGVKAYRISDPFRPQINILTWALSLNQEVERVAADIYYSVNRGVDLIDVQDWHFVSAAVSLKRALKIPFIFSIDSLEGHRSRGSRSPLNLSIMSVESLGVNEADRIVVKSDWMRHEVNQACNAALDSIEVVSPSSPHWIDEILIAYRKESKVIAA